MSDLDNIRVVSAVADTKNLILYKEDGTTITIKQGDHRMEGLLKQIIPITTRGEVAVISLSNFTVYADFQEKTNGFVKFFKVAKSKIAGIFNKGEKPENTDIELPQEIVPAPVPKNIPMAAPIAANTEVAQGIVKQIRNKPAPEPEQPVEGATVPQPSPAMSKQLEPHMTKMTDDNLLESETIVAVIGDHVIPNIEKIKPYLAYAVKHSSEKAVVNFLNRLVPMLDKRGHSIEDLLRFMEKGDLPLAEDGCIIAYKVLRYKKDKETGKILHYVDCHTGKIPQKVGSFLVVDEKLVDTNRRNECSNGLHIARRGYVGGFSGDVCVLAKIAPEDVVTVPHNDPNKVRVMGYHILAELPKDAFAQLKRNVAATSIPEVQKLLTDAIKGNHVAKLEEVRVTKQLGEGIIITQLVNGKKITTEYSAEELKKAESLDQIEGKPVDVKDLNKRLNTERAEVEAEKAAPPTRKLDIETKADIQLFINNYGGATFSMAALAKNRVAEGSNVYQAFVRHPDRPYRDFIANFSENVFNDQVNAIFKEVAPQPVKEAVKAAPKKKVAAKKPEPKKEAPKPKAKTSTPVAQPKPTPAPVKGKAKAPATKPATEVKPTAKGQPTVSKNEKKAVIATPVATKAPVKKSTSKVVDNIVKNIKETQPKAESKKKKAVSQPSAKGETQVPVSTANTPQVQPHSIDAKKANVFKLSDEGKSATEISKLTGIPRGTLAGWIKKR